MKSPLLLSLLVAGGGTAEYTSVGKTIGLVVGLLAAGFAAFPGVATAVIMAGGGISFSGF